MRGVENSQYDSSKDTYLHKENIINVMMLLIIPELFDRAEHHDDSKLRSPEKEEVYNEFIPTLKPTRYGSPEYESIRKEMSMKGGKHHSSVNRHHLEFFKTGISGMNMNDLMEMVCDWFAASLRSDTSFIDGLDLNVKKYGIPPMLENIIVNTYNDYFKKFEEFMKSFNLDKVNKLGNEYKLIAYENCQKGL